MVHLIIGWPWVRHDVIHGALSSITLACPDPGRLAAFYAAITGSEVTFVHQTEWATMRCEGARLEFMGVENYQSPRWPEDSSILHLDFYVDDLEQGTHDVERVGARRYEHQPNAAHCLVFADPDGHPFCLSLIDEVDQTSIGPTPGKVQGMTTSARGTSGRKEPDA